jgi:hypothetical protein
MQRCLLRYAALQRTSIRANAACRVALQSATYVVELHYKAAPQTNKQNKREKKK